MSQVGTGPHVEPHVSQTPPRHSEGLRLGPLSNPFHSSGIRVRYNRAFRLRLINIAGLIGISCGHCASEMSKV